MRQGNVARQQQVRAGDRRNRTGYHDTMTNLDLDHAAAVKAITIEFVAQAATYKDLSA
jgi:hypothetical protein